MSSETKDKDKDKEKEEENTSSPFYTKGKNLLEKAKPHSKKILVAFLAVVIIVVLFKDKLGIEKITKKVKRKLKITKRKKKKKGGKGDDDSDSEDDSDDEGNDNEGIEDMVNELRHQQKRNISKLN